MEESLPQKGYIEHSASNICTTGAWPVTPSVPEYLSFSSIKMNEGVTNIWRGIFVVWLRLLSMWSTHCPSYICIRLMYSVNLCRWVISTWLEHALRYHQGDLRRFEIPSSRGKTYLSLRFKTWQHIARYQQGAKTCRLWFVKNFSWKFHPDHTQSRRNTVKLNALYYWIISIN
jgi:hypothetical protein